MERPGKRGDLNAEEAERNGDGQSPWRVAHVIGCAALESGVALDLVESGGIVGIVMMDELLAGGPVDDVVASGDDLAIEGKNAEKQNGKKNGKSAGDSDQHQADIVLLLLAGRIGGCGHLYRLNPKTKPANMANWWQGRAGRDNRLRYGNIGREEMRSGGIGFRQAPVQCACWGYERLKRRRDTRRTTRALSRATKAR